MYRFAGTQYVNNKFWVASINFLIICLAVSSLVVLNNFREQVVTMGCTWNCELSLAVRWSDAFNMMTGSS